MKVQCPCCSARVPVENINLDTGWGKCEACQELFLVADAVPGFSAAGPRPDGPVERPFNARAIVERNAGELLVHVPAEGMRAASWALLGFATFWLAFIAFWTIGALGIFGGRQPAGAVNWVFASFSIPFWLIGFGMLGGVAWKAWGTKSIQVDQQGMWMYQRCQAWSRSRWVELDRVQHARHYDTQQVKSNMQRSQAVEVVYRAGSFVLPVDGEEEERWLIAEINNYLKKSSEA